MTDFQILIIAFCLSLAYCGEPDLHDAFISHIIKNEAVVECVMPTQEGME